MTKRLTIGEQSQIRSIKAHLATVDYQSYSATAIFRLLKIIERLVDGEQAPRDKGESHER